MSPTAGEKEFLFSPLSHLEVIGNPRVELVNNGGKGKKEVVVVSIKVNINQKSRTLEEILELRKHTVMTAGENLKKEIKFDLKLVSDKSCDLSTFTEGFETLAKRSAEWFNSDTNFAHAVNCLLELKGNTIEKNLETLPVNSLAFFF
jgi:hypothetical protein